MPAALRLPPIEPRPTTLQDTALVRAVFPDGPVLRLRVEQYHAMIERGILGDEDPVELLEGALIHKMPIDEIHAACVDLVDEMMRKMLPAGWTFRNQNPITLVDSEPQPDGAVVRGDQRTYYKLGRKPGPADIAIVIEVSDSTLSRDRSVKHRIYAANGIRVYWIVNLVDRAVEVYTEPVPSDAKYGPAISYRSGERVPVVVGGLEVGTIAVDDLLP